MHKVVKIMQEAAEEAHYLHEVAGFWEVRDTGVGVLLAIHFLNTVPEEEILQSYRFLTEDDLTWLSSYYKKNKRKIDAMIKDWLDEEDYSLPCYA